MTYYLSLGANIGEREQTLRKALEQIEQHIGPVRSCSSFYYSAPWGFTSGHAFCNLCCAVESDKSPVEVLDITQAIEKALGRTKKTERANLTAPVYSDRSIDIDLIRVFEGEKEMTVCTNRLVIPHPLWQEREFVKVPLGEIMR